MERCREWWLMFQITWQKVWPIVPQHFRIDHLQVHRTSFAPSINAPQRFDSEHGLWVLPDLLLRRELIFSESEIPIDWLVIYLFERIHRVPSIYPMRWFATHWWRRNSIRRRCSLFDSCSTPISGKSEFHVETNKRKTGNIITTHLNFRVDGSNAFFVIRRQPQFDLFDLQFRPHLDQHIFYRQTNRHIRHLFWFLCRSSSTRVLFKCWFTNEMKSRGLNTLKHALKWLAEKWRQSDSFCQKITADSSRVSRTTTMRLTDEKYKQVVSCWQRACVVSTYVSRNESWQRFQNNNLRNWENYVCVFFNKSRLRSLFLNLVCAQRAKCFLLWWWQYICVQLQWTSFMISQLWIGFGRSRKLIWWMERLLVSVCHRVESHTLCNSNYVDL